MTFYHLDDIPEELQSYFQPAPQIGLEQSPQQFVDELVAVFRDVRRVLRDDGTLWLNLGDSYAAQRGGSQMPAETLAGGDGGFGDRNSHRGRLTDAKQYHRDARAIGLKHKDLMGMPWRVAFALQADGWYLRQDIIWAKPNPMPESVTDRCTKSHEYIFLLSKSERYYYDQNAILEPMAGSSIERLSQDVEGQAGSDRVPGKTNGMMKAVSRAHLPGNKSHKGTTAYEEGDERHRTKAGLVDYAQKMRSKAKGNAKTFRGGGAYTQGQSFANGDIIERESHGNSPNETGMRNKRSVWTVATQPFKQAHFATFPPALIEPCILAGCPRGGTVLDPFGGAGTTGLVADRHQRNAILLELNPEYAAMAEDRIQQGAGMFA